MTKMLEGRRESFFPLDDLPRGTEKLGGPLERSYRG